MKLYKFGFSKYRASMSRKVLEVEEKPKTYIATETSWKTRVNKSSIGTVDLYDNVYLLEDDERKAKEIFCEKLKGEISRIKSDIERKEKEITDVEQIISEFQKADDNTDESRT